MSSTKVKAVRGAEESAPLANKEAKMYYVSYKGLPRRLIEAYDETMAAYVYKQLLALSPARPDSDLTITEA